MVKEIYRCAVATSTDLGGGCCGVSFVEFNSSSFKPLLLASRAAATSLAVSTMAGRVAFLPLAPPLTGESFSGVFLPSEFWLKEERRLVPVGAAACFFGAALLARDGIYYCLVGATGGELT